LRLLTPLVCPSTSTSSIFLILGLRQAHAEEASDTAVAARVPKPSRRLLRRYGWQDHARAATKVRASSPASVRDGWSYGLFARSGVAVGGTLFVPLDGGAGVGFFPLFEDAGLLPPPPHTHTQAVLENLAVLPFWAVKMAALTECGRVPGLVPYPEGGCIAALKVANKAGGSCCCRCWRCSRCWWSVISVAASRVEAVDFACWTRT